ncbi:ubiquinol cytochrome c reductase [Micromonas commoda]|uniref:Ubiquinol cytochrome c reductase n=1 Tax=Micromonas commoda (strain RCC299 / NOUM17 / CCMP2709) TaxID=296587 RepID=C1FEG7_MICCC|nr:ubiquinol cytochrome c reductase [Micromonas commoda]ACO68958.1 ubiquinol cytochrome c reductase [Micromonas commoda]|eukprot:XP_002507700.1 ubiquinol cytochrome c reductase [Micromonas commoda]
MMREKHNSKVVGKLLRFALSICGFYSEESVHQRAADRLYSSVVCQIEDSNILAAFRVESNFQGIYGMIVLHVWMLLSRLRSEREAGKELSQAMYDIFQEDVERRLHLYGLRVNTKKWLRELEYSFYGSVLAYDEALRGKPGTLAAALQRNVFQERGDIVKAEVLERYVRRELSCLNLTTTEAIFEGRIQFSGIRHFQNLCFHVQSNNLTGIRP